MNDVIYVLLLALIAGALWHRQLKESGWDDKPALLSLSVSLGVAAGSVFVAIVFTAWTIFELLFL